MTDSQAPGAGRGKGEIIAAAEPATLIESCEVVKSFGQTPALRGANLAARVRS